MPKEFYSVDDIAEILDIGYDAAKAIMHRLPTVNTSSPISNKPRKRVRIIIFNEWLAQQDGYSPSGKPLRSIKGGLAP